MKPWVNLKELRKERDWTQLQAAEKLGFCRSYIAAVETGRQGISFEMMRAIMRVFDVTYEDFFRPHDKPAANFKKRRDTS